MKNFQRLNNILGWLTFIIASTVYILCLEPTASFWDCGEFIATAWKLEVGHPPGAPLFQMLARMFMLMAGSDIPKASVMVNMLSALASGATIMFLFWTITHFAKKLIRTNNSELTFHQGLLVLGSGLVGALAYTFSDSFWFSAVEGEVYATSSLFTAIVFWAILKWENVANEKHHTRWIILIAYLMGLSIGVHLLNLLTIPALGFVYYFKKYTPSIKGFIITFVVSVFILGFVQGGIIPGLVSLAAKFDLFFVNTLGLPFGSGVLVYALLIITGIFFGLKITRERNKSLWNTAILAFTFIIIGYSSFALIVIRSQANPPMDENNPENVFTLLSYLNREQYGDRPLLYGQYYTAKYIDQEKGDMTYAKGKDKYIETGKKVTPIYEPDQCTVFPRMWSNQSPHIRAYKDWGGVQGERKPTFLQNMKFFFSYQLNFMYWRYFMWNFAGRQNDIQGDGNIKEGNWISGIKFLDAMRLGPQDKLPESMTSNKGYNRFYFLPLILGLFGLFFQLQRDKLDTWVVFLLFFLTGIAIVIYLNQTPYQPRERDYAYAGSFYAFAIWIGLGVLGIADMFQKKMSPKIVAPLSILIGLLAGPAIMAKDGWDDHDRSHRYTSRDFAADYLNSCAPNAIIFTNGDNDTFPLWYVQEVEGVRTDVRVVNLSLLNTDWYIDQMKRKAYKSDPIPYSLTPDKYVQGTRDYIPYYEKTLPGYTNLKDIIDFMGSDNPETKVVAGDGEKLNYFPTKKFAVPVDTIEVIKNGTVTSKMAPFVSKAMTWDLDKNYILKADLAILDILANNNWKRPVYFAITVGNDSYLNLEDYFQLEGLAYRIVPVKNPRQADGQSGRVETDIMYKNVMEKFVWGNMNDPRVYLDENNLRMTMNFRNNFARLAEKLIEEGKRDSALKVLDRCLEVMPDKTVPYNVFSVRIAELYYTVARNVNAAGAGDVENNKYGKAAKSANQIVSRLADIYKDDLNYYFSLGGKYSKQVERDIQQGMSVFEELIRVTRVNNQTELSKRLEDDFKKLQDQYSRTFSN